MGSTTIPQRQARFEVLYDGAEALILRDVGPWDQHPTITNDPQSVCSRVQAQRNGRTLLYVDSEGELDELLVDSSGWFINFRTGRGSLELITRLLIAQLTKSAGAVPVVPGETAAGDVANALQMLRAARSMDVDLCVEIEDGEGRHPSTADEIDRRLSQALDKYAKDAAAEQQLRKVLVAAEAEIKKLQLALRAPEPRGIARWVMKNEADPRQLIDTFVTVLSDGSLRHYFPHYPAGQRFQNLDPIPTTRAAVLASDTTPEEALVQ